MQYYARANTAHPAIGLISIGEVLTKEQAEALGAEKIAELLERGVLAACGGNPQAAPSPAATPEPDEQTPEQPNEEESDYDSEPEALDIADEIVNDEAPAEELKGSAKGRKKK